MLKEYKTVSEISGPLMMVEEVLRTPSSATWSISN
jgi:vacuolar-type H+-ATPase subunit B/Vma2